MCIYIYNIYIKIDYVGRGHSIIGRSHSFKPMVFSVTQRHTVDVCPVIHQEKTQLQEVLKDMMGSTNKWSTNKFYNRKTMGKPWENGGLSGFYGMSPLVNVYITLENRP